MPPSLLNRNMDEYLETLKIQASEGDTQAAQELQQTLDYLKKQQQVIQNFASKLRADGFNVDYRTDGGIDINTYPPKEIT